ncbi:MAG TPA: trypsin-like peptidase domain-containing protein [Solirubrobacteraceae bacterium]|nr:trypsin-like peptidase domain-containing protein [Solirubrobacteraceae bacterium]
MSSPGSRRTRLVLPLAIGVIVVLAAAVVVGLVTNNKTMPSTTTTVATSTAATSGPSCDVTSVAEQQLPAVVTIMAASGTGGGVGSGEVIRSNGYIVTNNHVIAPALGGGSLEVIFDNGESARATLVGRDPLTDLAVIRVDKSNLHTITIGNSSGLRIGQPVVALGAPLGLSSTVTSGIVSALGRTVHVPGEGSGSALLVDAVQTDASINPGNSGGALVNCSGALVGIPTAGASTGETGGSIGLGFAIPVNSAVKIADEIISTGSVTHSFIGVQAQPLAASATGQGGQAAGLWIVAVVRGSPAASAGLQEGDIIRTIDGDPATSTDQLMAVSLTKRPGDRVEVGYERDGRQATATITLTSRPSAS